MSTPISCNPTKPGLWRRIARCIGQAATKVSRTFGYVLALLEGTPPVQRIVFRRKNKRTEDYVDRFVFSSDDYDSSSDSSSDDDDDQPVEPSPPLRGRPYQHLSPTSYLVETLAMTDDPDMWVESPEGYWQDRLQLDLTVEVVDDDEDNVHANIEVEMINNREHGIAQLFTMSNPPSNNNRSKLWTPPPPPPIKIIKRNGIHVQDPSRFKFSDDDDDDEIKSLDEVPLSSTPLRCKAFRNMSPTSYLMISVAMTEQSPLYVEPIEGYMEDRLELDLTFEVVVDDDFVRPNYDDDEEEELKAQLFTELPFF